MTDDLKDFRAPTWLDAISEDPALWFIAALIVGLILDAVQR